MRVPPSGGSKRMIDDLVNVFSIIIKSGNYNSWWPETKRWNSLWPAPVPTRTIRYFERGLIPYRLSYQRIRSKINSALINKRTSRPQKVITTSVLRVCNRHQPQMRIHSSRPMPGRNSSLKSCHTISSTSQASLTFSSCHPVVAKSVSSSTERN